MHGTRALATQRARIASCPPKSCAPSARLQPVALAARAQTPYGPWTHRCHHCPAIATVNTLNPHVYEVADNNTATLRRDGTATLRAASARPVVAEHAYQNTLRRGTDYHGHIASNYDLASGASTQPIADQHAYDLVSSGTPPAVDAEVAYDLASAAGTPFHDTNLDLFPAALHSASMENGYDLASSGTNGTPSVRVSQPASAPAVAENFMGFAGSDDDELDV